MTCLTIKHYHSDEATAKQWNLKFIALSNQPRVDNAIPSACLLSLAENYKTEQWYGAALSAYQDAYCLDKRLICVPYQEANIFYQMQCYEETIERLNRAIINGLINGDNDLLTKAYYLRANVYKECGVNADNLINAKNDFLALCDISPNYLDAKIGLEECEEALKKIN
jgi:tetratricopeptide (TPR) repeat protein